MCIGSASRDIFFPLEDVRVYNTPEDLTSKKNILLELGAKYRTENRYEAPGGCSLNVSLALARLEVQPLSYSVVGEDTYGEEIIADLSNEGVDTRYLTREKGVGTDVACIIVEPKSADRTVVYNRDANERLKVKKEDIENLEEIFVSGMYGEWQDNITVIEGVVKDHLARVYYNPGQRNIVDDVHCVVSLMGISEIVFVNKDEAIEVILRENENVERDRLSEERYLAEVITSFGAKYAVITDGDRGAWVYNRETCYFARSRKVEHIVDSTGAGDAFTGAFIAAYLRGKDMAECLRWGIANGGSVVQYYGARDGLLTLSEMSVVAEQIEVIVV